MGGNLEIRLLGSPIVTLDGVPVMGFRSRKAYALLFYLAVTQKPLTRLALTDLFWEDVPESNARRSLNTTLSNLRKLVPDHLVITSRDVFFNRQSPFWLDVDALESCAGRANLPSGINEQAATLELYRGDFLDGFYIDGAPGFEQWVSVMRARLHESACAVLQALTDHYEQAANWIQAITYCRRMLALAPWREEAHRQLMLLLAHSGQRTSALAQFEICRQLLAEELAVDPAPETVALFEQIKTGDLPNVHPAPVTPVTPPSNLPAQTTPFVGRQAELAELTHLLHNPALRLVTILAPGGMGKTRLALEVAAQLRDHFPDGIYFVPPTRLDTADDLVMFVAGAVGCQFSTTPGSRKQQLFDHLRTKQLLLILDGFEHLRIGAELLHELLQIATQVRLLVTSRERLKLSGETVFRLGGMEMPALDRADLRDASAVQMFVQAAHRHLPGFVAGDEDLAAIADICRLVHGMPLAILLAAAWIDTLAPRAIASEIGQNIEFLAADLRDLPSHQRSIAAVLNETWARLTEAERGVFACLSVFRGGFTRQAAQAVSGAALETLGTLTDKGLLWRDVRERYGIHELLGQYAEEKLITSEQARAVRDAHAAYYMRLLDTYSAKLQSPQHLAALAELEQELANLRAGWQWAIHTAQLDQLLRGVDALCRFYELRAYYQEGEAICETAIALVSSSRLEPAEESSLSLQLLAKLLIWQGGFGKRLGRAALPGQLCQRALDLLDRLTLEGHDVRADRASALLQLGTIQWYLDTGAAHASLLESLALCREIGDTWTCAAVLRELARLDFALLRYEEAYQYAQESLMLRRANNDQMGLPATLAVLSWITEIQGHTEQSELYAQEQFRVAQAIGSQNLVAQALFNIGSALMRRGEFTQALTRFEQSRTITEKIQDHHHLSTLNIWSSEANLHLGHYTEADTFAQRSLLTAADIGLPTHRGDALVALAQVRLVEEAFEDAARMLDESRAIFEEIRQPTFLIPIYALRGIAAYKMGDFALARRSLAQLWQRATQGQNFTATLELLPLAALLMTEHIPNLGGPEDAVTLYAAAQRYPYIANSRWYADVVGHAITAQSRKLPRQVVQKLRQRGAALPIDIVLAGIRV